MPRKVILGCTGSVAAMKVPEIVGEFSKLTDVRMNGLHVKSSGNYTPCINLLAGGGLRCYD